MKTRMLGALAVSGTGFGTMSFTWIYGQRRIAPRSPEALLALTNR